MGNIFLDVPERRRRSYAVPLQLGALIAAAFLLFYGRSMLGLFAVSRTQSLPTATPVQCAFRNARAGSPPAFAQRTENDRYVRGVRPIAIVNATVWDGTAVSRGKDVLVERGLITAVATGALRGREGEFERIDAHGAWLTPGLIDMHAHYGVFPVPSAPSTSDGNSFLGPVQPQLRAVDAFNVHDESLPLIAAGGVTSALLLPGSLNNFGGQGYPIKLGKFRASSAERLIDPPRALVMPDEATVGRDGLYTCASGMQRPDGSTAFRHIKIALGENPQWHGLTRLDEAWNFRRMFARARRLVDEQDAYCERADASVPYPTDLEVEVLADAIRGRVKIHAHCYSVSDMDTLVRISNEFRVPIASLHHAHEAYLVPELLHRAYNGTPAVALFSTNGNYKYESYFGSPFASEILRRHNVTPIFKSDHPVTDSRRVLVQAAQAHHFGLPEADALRAVTSAPAHTLGLAHRIGHVHAGHDADLVLWDRHPLELGATPAQVIIDGVPQLEHARPTGESAPPAPPSADYAAEIARVEHSRDAILADVEPAFPSPATAVESVVLYNVSTMYQGQRGRIIARDYDDGLAVYARGTAACIGEAAQCLHAIPPDATHIDLAGGVIMPGITAFSSTAALGLEVIPSEHSTTDGQLRRPSRDAAVDVGSIGARLVPRAADGLVWGSHELKRAHASGVATAVATPRFAGEFAGVSALFDTGAAHVLQPYAVRAHQVAVHVALQHDTVPISAQVALLREVIALAKTQLYANSPLVEAAWLAVARGTLPLVVKADSVAAAAQVLALKREFADVRFVLDSAAPLHMLASELAESGVGVFVPLRHWWTTWDTRGALPGAPLSNTTDLGVLLAHGVLVGASIAEPWEAANLVWEAAWALMDANTTSDGTAVLELLTTNIEELLGLPARPEGDFYAYSGSPFTFGSKVVAAGTPRGIELFP